MKKTRKSLFEEQEQEWYDRLCMCRQTLFFLRKEIAKVLKRTRKFERYYQENMVKKPDELDFTEIDKLFQDYKSFLKKNNELSLRAERETATLKSLAEEDIEFGYLHDYQ